MAERHQTRRPVDLAAEVVPVAFDRLAGVQAHADGEPHVGVGPQLALGLDGGRGGAGRRGERRSEPVTTGREHVPAVAIDGVAQDRVVDLHGGGHVGRGFVPEPRRILDVGEEERHRPRWRRHGHEGTVVAEARHPNTHLDARSSHRPRCPCDHP